MLEQSELKICQKSTLSLSDSLARICLLLESEQVSQHQEAVCFLKQCESSRMQDPHILSLKTSRVFSQVPMENVGKPYLKRLPTLGMMVNGNYLIQGGF